MEVGEKLGYALLERSITGRYRIAHTSSGNAPFRCGVIEENGGKQLLFQGRNTFGEIDRVQITLDRGYEYELKLPRKEVFFIHTGVDSRIPTGLASVEQITLYDGEGRTSPNHFSEHGRHSVKTAKTEGPSRPLREQERTRRCRVLTEEKTMSSELWRSSPISTSLPRAPA